MEVEVKVCKNCRRLFKYIYGPDLCPDCSKLLSKEESHIADKEPIESLNPMVKEEVTLYEQVSDYIMSHPKATLVHIAEANNTTPMKLLQWIREERLEFTDESKSVWFECEKCGTRIRCGRLCNRCKL